LATFFKGSFLNIAKNTVVEIDYVLTDPSGKTLDTSAGRGPLTYMHGTGSIIPGLESALEGKQAGEGMRVTIPAEEAYGPRDEQLVQPVPHSAFGGVTQIDPGMQFEARTPQGSRLIRIVKVEGDQVTIDANHPLAGIPLTFDVKVVSVRAATDEEISHGHAHGPGGHQH
jgi:FKBP-type peptidyl-prolyl cis-trans isomerase SlyD